MKKIYKKMFDMVVVTALILGIFIFRKYDQQTEKEILNNGEFAIGTVLREAKVGGHSRANVTFSFYCDTNKIVIPLSKYPPNKSVQRNEKYLVAYLYGNPKKAIMLYDYPIQDSLDFKKHVRALH